MDADLLRKQKEQELVAQDKIVSALKRVLNAIPSRRLGLKAIVAGMYDDIRGCYEDGWSLNEIAGMMKEGGVTIAGGTLGNYLREENTYRKRKVNQYYDLDEIEIAFHSFGINIGRKEIVRVLCDAKAVRARKKLDEMLERVEPGLVVQSEISSEEGVKFEGKIEGRLEEKQPAAKQVVNNKKVETRPPPTEVAVSKGKEAEPTSPVAESKASENEDDEPKNAAGIPLSFFKNPTVHRFNKIRRPGDPK